MMKPALLLASALIGKISADGGQNQELLSMLNTAFDDALSGEDRLEAEEIGANVQNYHNPLINMGQEANDDFEEFSIEERITAEWEEVKKSSKIDLSGALAASENGDLTQASRSISDGDIKLIKNYGCWCNFDRNVKRKGKPVDVFDQACKTLHEGYECVAMDDPVCDIVNQSYKSAVGGGAQSPMSMDRLKVECERANKNQGSCAVKLCKVEGWFVQTIFKKVFSELMFPDRREYASAFGNFDKNTDCPTVPTGGPVNKECCGSYPVRFPYRIGSRGCCGGKTYNNVAMLCCNDGSVKTSCEDP